MKLTQREEDSCRVDAFAEIIPPYEVRIVPGWGQPEYETCEPYRIDLGVDTLIRTELHITVGQEYMEALREHGVKYARGRSQQERGL